MKKNNKRELIATFKAKTEKEKKDFLNELQWSGYNEGTGFDEEEGSIQFINIIMIFCLTSTVTNQTQVAIIILELSPHWHQNIAQIHSQCVLEMTLVLDFVSYYQLWP